MAAAGRCSLGDDDSKVQAVLRSPRCRFQERVNRGRVSKRENHLAAASGTQHITRREPFCAPREVILGTLRMNIMVKYSGMM